MATATERLALLITANGQQAIRELGQVGSAAKKGVGDAERQIAKLENSLSTIGAASIAGGAVVASGLYMAVRAASDLGESSNKASVIFGRNFGQIQEFAEGAADSIGQSKRAALDAASTFGGIGKAAGLSGGGLTDFAKTLTKLSSDLASFDNTTPEEAVLALGAALRGETEPIRRYRVFLDDATLRMEAFRQGLTKDTKSPLTPQVKALAAYQQILKQTTDQQDDYERTSGSLANRTRKLANDFENLKASVGESALPAFEQLADVAGTVLDTFDQMPDAVNAAVGGVAGVGSAAALSAGSVALLAAQVLKMGQAMKEAKSAGGLAGALAGAAGPIAAIVAAAGAGAALQTVIDNDLTAAAKNAAGSMEEFKRSIPTNDLEDLRNVAGATSALISKGPDLTAWQVWQRALGGVAVGIAGAGTSGTTVIDMVLGRGDDAKFRVEALNTQIDNFKQSLQGLDREVAAQRISTFIAGLAESGLSFAALTRIQIDLAAQFGSTSTAAEKAADSIGDVGEKAETSAEKFRNAQSALSSVTSASDRLKKANENLAKLSQRDTKTIEGAYQRIIDAKQRLDDILAGDGNGLEQESPAAQEARARAKLAEANARLAVNPKDSSAQTLKDEAISEIEAAQRRGQELARSAQDTARQVRDANEELAQAQADYAEAVKPPSPDELNAAWQERAEAELAQATAIAEFAQGVEDGKLSVEAFTDYLDSLVARGLISPETAAFFKTAMGDLATAAAGAAQALAAVPNRNPDARSNQQFGSGGFNPRGLANDIISRVPGLLFGPSGSANSISEETGRERGLFVRDRSKSTTVSDSTGNLWRWDPARKRWMDLGPVGARAAGGPVSGGSPYLVGENGPELMIPNGSGYVVNARQTAAAMNSGGTTWNVTNHIVGVRDPEQAAVATVRKMRAKTFLKTGA